MTINKKSTTKHCSAFNRSSLGYTRRPPMILNNTAITAKTNKI